MARFTLGGPVNFTWRDRRFKGSAGSEFRLDDSLRVQFLLDLGDRLPRITWLEDDEIDQLDERLDALEIGGGNHPSLATHDALGLATDVELGDSLDAHEAAVDPHIAYQRESEKGVAGGYASLDGGATIPDAQIPSTIARDSELPDLAGHAGAADPHTGYALDADLSGHAAAADPHTGYQLESGKGAISGYAGLGADSLVPQDQLGTGAQDGTKFLRDDGTWQAAGGAHPDLATHDTLGLATDSELSAHAAAADPHTVYQKESEKGAANGYASLDGSILIPDAQIPSTIARDSELHAQLHAASHLSAGSDPVFAETVPSTQAFGDTAIQGADSTKVAKLLHRHAMPANPVTAHEAAADPHIGYQRESEKDAASGYAGLTAGTIVAQTQLGSGAADGTKYLRDDRVWFTPTSAPAPDNRLIITHLGAQHSVSTIAPTKVTGLNTTLAAGTYLFDYRLIVRAATAGVAPQFNLNLTGTGAPIWWFQYADLSATLLAAIGQAANAVTTPTLGFQMATAVNVEGTTGAAKMGPIGGLQVTAADHMVQITGIVVVSVSGSLELWHGSETATATTVEVGSTLVLHKAN